MSELLVDNFRGAKEEPATEVVTGCFNAPREVLARVGLVTEGRFSDDNGLGGGGLVGEGFLIPTLEDGCLSEGDVMLVGAFKPVVISCWFMGDCGLGSCGDGLDIEDGCFSPPTMADEGCLNEGETFFSIESPLEGIPEKPVNLDPAADAKAPLAGIPLEPGFRKPLILEAPEDGGMIPEFGALIASSTFGSPTSSVSCVCRTKIP